VPEASVDMNIWGDEDADNHEGLNMLNTAMQTLAWETTPAPTPAPTSPQTPPPTPAPTSADLDWNTRMAQMHVSDGDDDQGGNTDDESYGMASDSEGLLGVSETPNLSAPYRA
jgi:hypothetical protein